MRLQWFILMAQGFWVLTVYRDVHVGCLWAHEAIGCCALICSCLVSTHIGKVESFPSPHGPCLRTTHKCPRNVWTRVSSWIAEQRDVIGLLGCGIMGNIHYWRWNWKIETLKLKFSNDWRLYILYYVHEYLGVTIAILFFFLLWAALIPFVGNFPLCF